MTVWTNLHAKLLCRATEHLLGSGEKGTMAFVGCLPPHVVLALAKDTTFSPAGWVVRRVADTNDPALRTITAGEAVELRESCEGRRESAAGGGAE
jgi:hypothetical protein